MINIRNQQRKIKVNLPAIERTIKKILKALTFPPDAELSLLLVNDSKIKELNSKYRGINRVTDVLSFPAKSHPPSSSLTKRGIKGGYPLLRGERGGVEVLGDIVIAMPSASRQAKEKGITLYEELSILLIHSILHLLGYTHESGSTAKRMRRKENEIALLLSSSKSQPLRVIASPD